MLRIFSSIKFEGKQSLPPVRDWMENSDILARHSSRYYDVGRNAWR